MGESGRENPPFPVAVCLIEPGNMVNDAQAAHLAADGLKHPRAKAVPIAERAQVREELTRGVLELDKDGQEYAPMVAIAREEELGKVIQPLDSGDLIAVELDLCGGHLVFSRSFMST